MRRAIASWMRPGIYLLVFAVALTIVLGGISNVFTASGLTPPGTTFNFTCDSTTNICSNNNPTGCNAGPSFAANCTLQNNNIFGGLLNPTSPFTTLLSGNVLGFLIGISASTTIIESVYTATGLGTANLYPGVCTAVYMPNATSLSTWVTTQCSVADQHNLPLGPSQAVLIAPTSSSANQTLIPLSHLRVTNASKYNTGYYQISVCLAMANYQISAGQYADILDGCQYYSTHNGVTSYWYYTANVNATTFSGNKQLGGNPGALTFAQCAVGFGYSQTQCPPTQIPVTIQPESWDVYSCGLQMQIPLQNGATGKQNIGPTGSAVYFGVPLPAITPQCQGVRSALAAANTNASQTSGLSVVLAFIMGIILLILGTGLGFGFTAPLPTTTTGAQASSNPQGTRMAQTLGIGLIVWTPVFSEFGGWLNILPNGLNIVAGFILTGMVFVGLMAIMLTGTSTTS